MSGNGLRPDAIPLLRQARRTHDINRDRGVNPTGQPARIAGTEIVTARQHCHSRRRGNGTTENLVGERSARVARHDNVARRISTSSSAQEANVTRPDSRGQA